jgi:hypothetical protein
MTQVQVTKTCECGNEFIKPSGWNNNYNVILRCSACEAKREALIAEINEAIAGKSVETVYVSSEVYHLLDANDFTVEVSRRKAERMNGQCFQVVEA